MVDIRKALAESGSTTGGSWVPVELANRFLDLVQAESVSLPLQDQYTMNSNVLDIPNITAGNTAYFTGENTTITSSDLTTNKVTLTAKKIAAITQLSTELMEDSNPQIGQKVAEQLARDVALKLDEAILNGGTTGYTTQLNGFRDTSTYTDINTVTASSGGDEISVAKLVNGMKEIRADNFKAGGTHLIIHPALEAKLRNLVDSNNRPLFTQETANNASLANGSLGRVLGLDIVGTTQLPTNLVNGATSTLTDAIIMTAGVSGAFGMRRMPQFNRFYVIEQDNWKVQTNLRAAFRVQYQKSVCILKDLKTV